MFQRMINWLFGPQGESTAESEQRRVAENTRNYARGLQARARWAQEEVLDGTERDHAKE
jgi:hypothetical protein